MTTVAIIGAGFSGMILAVNLMRSGDPGDELIVIEKRHELGLGQAYSTKDETHLLNIPPAGMSPFSRQPMAFAEYLKARGLLDTREAAQLENFYAPRKLFGEYLRHIVATQLNSGADRPRLTRVEGEAVEITRDNEIKLADGRNFHADRIVLAMGNLPPKPLRAAGNLDADIYSADPWVPGAVDTLAHDANVLLIGTGLTMLDYVQSLGTRDHKGEIIAVSRHGLLPRRSLTPDYWKPFIHPEKTYTVRQLVRLVRQQIAEALRQGVTWQSVLNSFRFSTQKLWTHFSPAEQARFIRHVRPWWDVHRHRIAPAVADRVESMQASGRLRVIAGHLEEMQRTAKGADVTIRRRGSEDRVTLTVQKIVNCSGPNYDFASSDEVLLKRLLEDGRISLNRHKLGVQVGDNFAAVDRDGVTSDDLFAMGPMLRGQYWEINAVAEIVAQAEAMAAWLWTMPQHRPAI
jgi:uncharacterized NAD(P)/FAD-binding protein YdhS